MKKGLPQGSECSRPRAILSPPRFKDKPDRILDIHGFPQWSEDDLAPETNAQPGKGWARLHGGLRAPSPRPVNRSYLSSCYYFPINGFSPQPAQYPIGGTLRTPPSKARSCRRSSEARRSRRAHGCPPEVSTT